MTDDEIDKKLNAIREEREANNYWFIEWLKTSFKCPNCKAAASRYQRLIRNNDQVITSLNSPLTKL